MAGKKRNGERVPWKGFININLTHHDADKLDEYVAENSDHFGEIMQQMLETGVRISIKWDASSKCFMSAMTCDNPDEPHAGYCITSRSRDLSECYWMCLYKHFVICEGDWTSHVDNNNDRFFWG